MSDLSKRILELPAGSLKLLAQRLRNEKSGGSFIRRQNREQLYFPLSRAQERLWFIDRMTPGNPAYNLSICFRYDTGLDIPAMERTFNALIGRHESLRTTFEDRDGSPVQVIHSAMTISLPITDLRGLPHSERERRALEIAEEEARQPFDLKSGPLIRAQVLRMGSEDYVLLWSVHHIVFDGSCGYIFPTELHQVYEAFCSGKSLTLPELPIQYVDYAVWQRERMRGQLQQKLLDYWGTQLSGVPVLDLPADHSRPPVYSYRGGRESLVLPRETGQALNRLSRESGATLFMTMLAAFQILLNRYSGQKDIVVGTPVANRNRIELENVVGMFVNTLALRTRLEGNPTFRELLARVRQVCMDGFANQELPFEDIVRELNPDRNLGHQPLFQVMFHLNNTQASFRLQDDYCQSLPQGHLWLHGRTALFDLTLMVESANASVRSEDEALHCLMEYSTDIFTSESVQRMLAHYQTLLEAAIANPDAPISELAIMREPERQQLLLCGNQNTQANSESVFGKRALHEIFQKQAANRPEAVAVSFGEQQISYGELNRRANRLAHKLRAAGVRRESIVGVLLGRSVEMMVAVLGILKAGGAYLPLEPDLPEGRVRYMLEDSGAGWVVTREKEKAEGKLAGYGGMVLSLEEEAEEERGAEEAEDLRSEAGWENAAYVIYTSGSTGKAKGVVVTHGNVVRLFRETERWYQFGEADVWTLYHSYAFDFSVWEMWGALLYGGRLVVVPQGVSRNPEAMLELLRRERVTVLNQTPSAFRQLVEAEGRRTAGEEELCLRWVIFGGEALDFQSLQPWFERHGEKQPRLINMYGITETTVHTTYRPVGREEAARPSGSLIGMPIGDLQIYLVDEYLNPVPIGVIGEICVGGMGLARGYLGRAELTAERFVPNPFFQESGERLYRSGDLGRRRADGDIEYMGRLDHQVKIRGFRIEIGEVESRLVQHPQIREAVVVCNGASTGDRQLVAYYVAVNGTPPTVDELRTHLRQQLPDYMVPSAFLSLPSMPLTANGKLDRKALPVPGMERPHLSETYEEPRTPAERALAEIWSQVLGVAKVGVKDNFFSMGGDSIRSLQVLSLATQRGFHFTLQDLFRHQTIAELAREAATDALPAEPAIAPLQLISEDDKNRLPNDVEDAYPLLTLQTGMLFHSGYSQGSSTYHDIFSYHLRTPFDGEAMRAALDQLCRRHSVLRTSFDLSAFSEPLQLVHASSRIPLQIEDWSDMDLVTQEQWLTRWMEAESGRDFDWAAAPLIRACVHRRGNETFQLSLSFHHAILDGWSMATLFNELLQHYFHALGMVADQPPDPPPDVLRTFVAAERNILTSPESRQYWAETIEDCIVTTLPRRSPQPMAESRLGEREFVLPLVVSSALSSLAKSAGVSLKSVLLAVHMRVLGLIGGQTDVLSGVVMNGRPEMIGAERALGLFLNVVPFRARLGQETWLELIRQVFQTEQELLPHRSFPLGVMQHNWHERPLFEVVFNFIHFHSYQQLSRFPQLELLEGKFFEETNFPLFVEFFKDPLTLQDRLSLRYDAALFAEGQVETFIGYYEKALHAVARDARARYANSDLLADKETRLLLAEFNDTQVRYPAGACIHTLLEAQARRAPEATALVFGTERLSYAELNGRANQLAHYLGGLGVGPEVRVGVLMNRSSNLVIAILGVLKAGGAYVPFDPAYPRERLNYMAQDAGMRVLLTEASLSGLLEHYSGAVVSVDSDWPAIGSCSSENPASGVSPENAAYVIYTSGSTGRPKGIAIEHRSTVTLLRWAADTFTEDEIAGVLASTSICFDLSLFELFVPLSWGGKIILVENALHLASLPAAEEVTLVNTVPSVIAELLCMQGIPRSLRVVNLAGEPLPHKLVQQIYEIPTIGKVYNLYGPTEDTTYSTFILVEKRDPRPPSIGRPVANTRVYLLDALLQLVPEGVVGELYIAGDGLARCYVEKPEQTADRFLPDLFGNAGERMYRTGDLARYRTDGALEYLGRVDHQVKLRGFRIELGEIEYLLGRHPGVSQAVVVVNESSQDKRLVAYIVPRVDPPPTAYGLREHLREKLPEHMVPAVFVMLERLPVTPNGKVDRRKLPAPEPLIPELDVKAAASTPIEGVLAGIWEEVLSIGGIGIHDNFFQLGGHSLMATRVISRVRSVFQVELPITALFSAPTIETLARRVKQAIHGEAQATLQITPGARSECIPASSGQHRLWLLQQLEPASPFLNMTAGVRLTGNLNRNALLRSLKEIVRRHESLRTRFNVVDGQLVQTISPSFDLPVQTLDLTMLAGPEQEAKLQELSERESMSPFDLSRGPMLRATLISLGETQHALLVSMHHIASDGWSVGVFTRELELLYEAFAAGRPSALKELPLQYADYAQWQAEWLQSQASGTLLNYWKRQLEGSPRALTLPLDRPRPAMPLFRGAAHHFLFPAKTQELLRQVCRREGVTLFMALLAIFEIVLKHETGQQDIVIGTDVANRQHSETEDLIGLFINELVLRVNLAGVSSFHDLLSSVRRTTLEAYIHQELPFDRLVAAMRPQRDLGVNPFFQIAFGIRNAPVTPLRLAGLTVDSIPIEHRVCVHDLGLYIDDDERGLRGEIIYNTDIFDSRTIARLAEHLQTAAKYVTQAATPLLASVRQILVEKDAQDAAQREGELAKAGLDRLTRVKAASAAAN